VTEPKFVQIETTDGIILPGLLYKANNSKKVAIYLHGNGSASVFYSDDQKIDLAQALEKKNISLLLFNNRGAHLIKKLTIKNPDGTEERKRFGMAYEKIKECVEDIDGAISFLKKRGFNRFYLIGESTGANKICVYHFYKPKNSVTKYILLSGGDDTGIYYDILGKEKFYKLLHEAKRKIKQKEGNEIICELLPDELFAYVGFYDIANPDGDYNCFPFYESINKVKLSKKPLFRYFKSINKPTLVVYGEKDEYVWGDVTRVVTLLKKQQPKFHYKIIKDADHGFNNQQQELAKVLALWID